MDSLRRELALTREDTAKALLFAGLSRAYVFSKPDSSFYYASEGLRLSRQTDFANGVATNFFELAIYFRITGASYQALRLVTEALPIFKTTGNAEGVILCTNMLAWLAQDQKDYRKSIDYSFEAMRLSRKDNNYRIEYAYSTLGESYEHIGKPDSALLYAVKGEGITETFSWNLRVLGDIHSSLNNDSTSLRYYRKAVTKNTASKDSSDIYIGMAKVFAKVGKSDSATYYLKNALQIATAGNFLFEVQQAGEMLAKLYRSRGQGDSTLKYLQISTDAKDSLFSQEKVKQFQSFAFNERLRQQERESEEMQYRSRIRTNILLIAMSFFLLLAVILYRNNKAKQTANFRLQQQKEEVQNTLTMLKKTQAQLIQSEKMASLGELTAGIAHEIQNPLNFVNNFSAVNRELLQEIKEEIEKGNLAEVNALAGEVEANEEKIGHHGRRADRIVKSMLQHSRSTSGEKEFTDLNALVEQYLQLAYHGYRAKDKSFNTDVRTNYDPAVGNIPLFPQEMGRVLLNLFNNAFYAVNEKKQQRDGTFTPAVSVSTAKRKGEVEICVKDNGTGIPRHVVNKIFQPFFTTKPAGEGTGLGLSLSYDIVTKGHGGTLVVHSTDGDGALFVVCLPL